MITNARMTLFFIRNMRYQIRNIGDERLFYVYGKP